MKTPLIRREIIEMLSGRLGLSGREAAVFLASFLELLSESLENNRTVTITGWGSFRTVPRPPKKGRHLNGRREILIPPGRRPVFTLSRKLRTILKETGGES